jgi:hypothetical protein
VEHVETVGRRIEKITVWSTLHFTSEGSPFCCGEPDCHLHLFGKRLEQIGDHIRRSLQLEQEVTVDMQRTNAEYHQGVKFRGQKLPNDDL